MINSKLNIFEYATKELSQDAVLLYLADCYNSEDKKGIGEKFLQSFYGDISGLHRVHPIKQYRHIDVLVVLEFENRLGFLIIEDKVYSREHDNQLERYKKDIVEGEFSFNGISSKPQEDTIIGVYFKPVLYNENEKRIAVERNGYKYKNYNDLLNVLESVHDDPILAPFREFFENRFKRENEMISATSFNDLKAKFPNVSDLMDSACGQWVLLKWLASEKFDSENYQSGKQYNGTSYGVPWTQYRFVIDRKSTSENWDGLVDFERTVRGRYSYFFRIHKESNGYYLSINQYTWDKAEVNADKQVERSKIADEANLKLIPNNYKESKVQVVYFKNWDELGEAELLSLKNTMEVILRYNLKEYAEDNSAYIGKRY